MVAFAQSGDVSYALEEVTVTATRREGSVQDVPINIAAVGAGQIESQGFKDVSDLIAYVPGINVVDNGGRNGNVIIVRGLNADPLGQGEGNDVSDTISTYIGEVPIALDFRLADIDRVEVLLGPQGTLYGAGTLSGAIRYLPRKPDTEDQYFEIRGDAFSLGEGSGVSSDVGFTVNLPLSDTFAIRASVDRLDNQGFVDYPYVVQQPGVSEPDVNLNDAAAVAANFAPIEDANSQEVLSGRVALRWQPTDAFDSTLTYYFQGEENGGRSTSGHRGPYPTSLYESPSRVPEPNDEDTSLIALEVTVDLGFAELTSATGYSEYEEVGQRDQSDLLFSLEYGYESFPTFTAFTREEEEIEILNQEIRLVSTGDSRFNWIVGGFYNKEEEANFSAEFTPGFAAFAGFDRPDDLEYFSTQRVEVVESAFFGELGFDITDRWSVTVGARRYEYEIDEVTSVDFPLFDPGFVAASVSEIGSRAFDPDLHVEDDGTLFKFNTSFQMNDDVLLYATVSEGFRIGGSNGGGPCPDFDPNATQGNCNLAPGQQFGPGPNDFAQFDERAYGPDETRNYELGAKTTLLDGAMTLNGAVYLIDWIDPQLSSATVNASIPIIINATGAESRGLELSSQWQVNESWQLRGSFSYTKTELTDPVPSLIRTITPPGFGTAFEDGEVGDRLPGAPETQFSMFSSYQFSVADGNDLYWNVGYSYQDEVLTRTGARGGSLTLNGYGLTNTSLVYEAESWTITAYVNNVFDKFAEAGAQSSARNNQIVGGNTSVRSFQTQILQPRTLGARFSYRF